jgi:arginyl-tRNA synthetase
MRGACYAEFEGETPEEMGQSCQQHVMEMVQSGDEAHKTAMDNMVELGKEEQEKQYEDFPSRFDSSQDA